MTGDCQVRFCGKVKVKFLCLTRLLPIAQDRPTRQFTFDKKDIIFNKTEKIKLQWQNR